MCPPGTARTAVSPSPRRCRPSPDLRPISPDLRTISSSASASTSAAGCAARLAQQDSTAARSKRHPAAPPRLPPLPCPPHQRHGWRLFPDPPQTRSIPAVDPTQAQHTCTAHAHVMHMSHVHARQVWPRRARHATLLPVERARVRCRATARGTDLGGGGATAWSRQARLSACSCRTGPRACSGLLFSAPAQNRRKRC
jgi:hypothetical protein